MEHPISLDEGNVELLVMTVEIGDGRQDVIRIHENDIPEDLARQFAQKHGLDPSLQENLTMLIRQNKEMVEIRTSSPDNFKWADYTGNMSNQSALPDSIDNSVQSMKAPIDRTRGNVYERLYKQGKKKPQSAAPNEDTAKPKSTSNINYGEWLYIKGMKQKEAQKLKAEEEKRKREAEANSEDYTFRPTINEYSRLLSPRYFEKTEDLLLRKAESYQERKNELKLKRDQELQKQCTFTPQLIASSNNVSRDSTIPKYESLYSEAELRKQKREQLSEISMKLNKPSVNKSRASAVSQEEYADHLLNYKKIYEEKRERAKEAQIQSELSRDGKPLFTPEIYSSPSQRAGNVFEQLYAKKDDKKNKIAQEYDNLLQRMSVAQTSNKCNATSQRMVEQLRGKRYAYLFTTLDSDADGVISCEGVDLAGLDDKTLQILTPIFQQLDEGVSFDLSNFVKAMEEIWETLTLDQRGHLLKKDNRTGIEDSRESFTINPNSAKLAEKKRSGLSTDIYERQVNAQKLTHLRLEKEKELKDKSEVQGCTFKPNILKSQRK